jgi:hydrogenase-4 membrane subunit HyfE
MFSKPRRTIALILLAVILGIVYVVVPLTYQQIITLILTSSMVPIALGIISVRAIQQMIRLYRVQSLILALLTLLFAYRTDVEGYRYTMPLLITFAVLIPGLLAYVIEPLLAQATVPRVVPWTQRLAYPFLRSRRYQEESVRSTSEALPVWLEHGLSLQRQIVSVVVSLFLTAMAYALAFILLSEELDRAQILAVSLTLLMLGIFTMINRQDLISQVIGLLVMDHGLFLAVVGVIALPSLIPAFVISLFLYILITLFILVILLPELHERSGTIEVEDQNELQG